SGPAVLRSATVVVGPNDLVHEAVSPEDAVEGHLDVVDLPVVEVDEQLARLGKTPKGRFDAGHQEALEVLERVVVGAAVYLLDVVATATEAASIAGTIRGGCLDPLPLLHLPGVEGRVHVDDGSERVGELRQSFKVVSENDLAHLEPRLKQYTSVQGSLERHPA